MYEYFTLNQRTIKSQWGQLIIGELKRVMDLQ